jgi:hypothetical protein
MAKNQDSRTVMTISPLDTEPGDTSPGKVQDLRQTSDIRLVMIQLAKVEERISILAGNDKEHRADFRWTWAGIAAAFLILASFFIIGYNRLEDKIEATTTETTKVDTKIDSILGRLNAPMPTPPAPGRRGSP